MTYRGKVVLITGAASGFGKLAAQQFAAQGARLVLGDLDESRLATVAGGVSALHRRTDVAEEADAAALVKLATDAHGRLDIAVNNAGVCHELMRLPDTPSDEFDRMMRVNARGVFMGLKAQLPVMAGQEAGGTILNVASAAGLVGAGMLAAYAASKHAVVGLTRSAADEYARKGVRVNALCPSFAATPMFDAMAGAFAEYRGEPPEEAGSRISARVPMRRVAMAEEVVNAMLWLCSDKNTFMTGQAIAIDGGLTAI